MGLETRIASASFLERAFLRWVLSPACHPPIAARVVPQYHMEAGERSYRIDYVIRGTHEPIAIELDGYAFHSGQAAFTYDRLRQNDLTLRGFRVLRFSYEAIRTDTARCVRQLQEAIVADPGLAPLAIATPIVAAPDDMELSAILALAPMPTTSLDSGTQLDAPKGSGYPLTDARPPDVLAPDGWFPAARGRLRLDPLRSCQLEALAAIGNYFRQGGRRAACVMSVGAGKTALGVATCLAYANRRALVVTPGSVIRGTFDRALDPRAIGNVLNQLPGGALVPGMAPPAVSVLDAEQGPISGLTRESLLASQVIVTNFHSLGSGEDRGDLLAKLEPGDIDLIVIDEAHIAAAASYQRLFTHFPEARFLLMSACFQRADGLPIEADVVFRYRLIDALADGHAKQPIVHRFAPDPAASRYRIDWPDGRREEIEGRDALLEVMENERALARVVATSDAPVREVVRVVARLIIEQRRRMAPHRPRVLFAALGEAHAGQISRIANEEGVRCGWLHHEMGDAQLRAVRERYEREAGDLDGVVHLRMLGQGYDLPPICIVVPMRPYGSFGDFYQFLGRGIRSVPDAAAAVEEQGLDVVYHADLGLDAHIEAVFRENDMDPAAGAAPDAWEERRLGAGEGDSGEPGLGPEPVVLFERGEVERRAVHDPERIARRRLEREREALAQRYADYVAMTDAPVPFEAFVQVITLRGA